MIKLPKNESCYSLVEVMASIMILAIAIIPMVSMFDVGLNVATRGSNYDNAWWFANKQLERAKTLPYADLRDNFPVVSSTPCAGGAYTSSSLAMPASAKLPGAPPTRSPSNTSGCNRECLRRTWRTPLRTRASSA